MQAAQLSPYPAGSPTHGTATLDNMDKLIQNLEFENKQQVKLIEKENEEKEELDRQTKEKKEEIATMQKAISQMDEDTKRLHRQFKYNRDNVGSLKRTCQLLYEHEEALKHKLKDVTNAGDKQRTDCAKMLEHFQNLWTKHQEVYESMPKVKTLRERQAALHNLQDTIKQAIERIEQLNSTIRNLENPTEEDAQMPVFPNLQSCIIKLAELKVDTTKNHAQVKEMKVSIRKLSEEVEEKIAERDRIIKEREAELQRRREEEGRREREKKQQEEQQEKERQIREQQQRERETQQSQEAQQHTSQQEAASQYFPSLISSQSNSVAAASLHPGAPPSSIPAPEQGVPQFPGLTSAGLGAKGLQAFSLLQPVQRKSPPKITIPTLMSPLPRHAPQPRQVPSFNFQHRQLPVVQQKAPVLQVYRPPNMPAQQPLLRQVQELQLRQKIDLQPTSRSPTKVAGNQAHEGSPVRMGDNQEQRDEEDSTGVVTDPMTPGPVHLPCIQPGSTSTPVTPGNSAPVTPANSNPSTPGEEAGSTSTSPFNMEKHRQHLLQLTSTSPGFSMSSRPMYQTEGGANQEEAPGNAERNIQFEEVSPFMQSFFTGLGGEPAVPVGSVPSMSSPEQQPTNTSTSAGSPSANAGPEKPPTSTGSPFFKGVPSPPSAVASFASMAQSAGPGVSSSAAAFFSTQNTSTSVSGSFSLGSVPPMSAGPASLFSGGDATTTTPTNEGGSFFAGFGGTSEKSGSASNLFGSGNLFGGGDNSPGSSSPQGFSFNFGGSGGSSPNSEAGTSGFSLFG
ncbi:Hypp5813 [Branchiostoma lanceolatum]|nr:Hypp5813 [Branchiostoma lanceolatum]